MLNSLDASTPETLAMLVASHSQLGNLTLANLAKTCKSLHNKLEPLLEQRLNAHLETRSLNSELCNAFDQKWFRIIGPGISLGKRAENLCELAENFDPKPLLDQKGRELFENLFGKACALSAPTSSPTLTSHAQLTLLNDVEAQQVFISLLSYASKLPATQRLTLFEHCQKEMSKYTFYAVGSVKKLMSQQFLLALMQYLPSDAARCKALETMMYGSFRGNCFVGSPTLYALNGFLEIISAVKDDQARGIALGKLAEQFPARCINFEYQIAALASLLEIHHGLSPDQQDHTAEKIRTNYPLSAIQPRLHAKASALLATLAG